jgi:drug/metabolite transporter (DMT)-like permease
MNAMLSSLPPTMRAVLWFCGTMAGFAGMAVAARDLWHSGMSVFEILAFRSFIGVAVVLPFVMRGGLAGLATPKIKMHFLRAVVQLGGQSCWIYGVALLALVEIAALEFTVPLWAALLAAPMLGERLQRHKWIATIGGFIGVMIILRPGMVALSVPALVVLVGSVFYALSGIFVKYLTRTDTPQLIVFYMNLIQLPIGLIPALFVWVTPSWSDVPWILVWGLSGLFAHYTMARALKLADISLIYPLDFLRLPFMALIGYLFYAELLDPWVALGAVVIFGANYYSVRRESQIGKNNST